MGFFFLNCISYSIECKKFYCFMLNISLFCFFSPSLAACGGELNAPSGTISSPNYPNLYPHSRLCRWELVMTPGRRVTLTINDLRLEASGGSCLFDYVDVSPFLPASPHVAELYLCQLLCHSFIVLIIVKEKENLVSRPMTGSDKA